MHPLARHIRAVTDADFSRYATLFIAGRPMGYLHPVMAEALAACPALIKTAAGFSLRHDDHVESRNTDLKEILAFLIACRLIDGERFELYPVADRFDAKPYALADRALMPALGLAAHGIHCNGYVVENGAILHWIGRRAAALRIEPGKLDHLVAGGQPYGLTLEENLAKEAWEEAGIPPHHLAGARRHGQLSYARGEPHGLRRDTLCIYDLELPRDFIPRNTDGEASGFQLLSSAEVRRRMTETDDFKFNVPLVLIDFFIRHGLIADDEPGYRDLAASLRRMRECA